MIHVGIDNGTSGAIAAIYPDGTYSIAAMPVKKIGDLEFIDANELAKLLIALKREDDVAVVFEQGQKNPMFGTKGNFANGYSFGVVLTALELSAVRHRVVNPATWQKIVLKDVRTGKGGDTKGASILIAKRLFPGIDLKRTDRSRKDDDGFADALCMAEFGRLEMARSV